MLYEYSNLNYPVCSVLISILVTILFFSKNNAKNKETNLYSKLIIITLIESIFTFSLTLCVHLFFNDSTLTIFAVANKVLYSIYILWISLMFLYFIKITDMKKDYIKAGEIFVVIFNVLTILSIFVNDINLVYLVEDKVSNSYGPAATILYIGCAVYLLLMVILTLINLNLKKNKKKYIPLFILVVLMTIAMAIRIIDPYCNILSNIISLIALIMYFTIENPDVKIIRELELAKNQAEKSNQAKTDFLSSMSHEIRTPLNAIVGLSEIIKDSDDLEEIHEDAKDVVDSSKNLLEIVNGILDINKIESGQIDVVNVEYNPYDVFNELADLIKNRIGTKEIELRTNFSSNIPNNLYGDKDKLKQILKNILGNAVKYTDRGYIDFNVSCSNSKDNCKLVIKIRDTGCGIKEDQLKNIFDMFYRSEEFVDSDVSGVGLGLAITSSLVGILNGNIDVDSVYGQGTEFIITILQKTEKPKINISEIAKKYKEQRFDNKKILIVDDNKLNNKVVSKILEDYGIIVDAVESGFDCIEKIKGNEVYDIIFMDIMMPEMDGLETLEKLKEIDNFNLPVVAFTADAMVGQGVKYLESGFDDYLTKPVDREELQRILNKYLN